MFWIGVGAAENVIEVGVDGLNVAVPVGTAVSGFQLAGLLKKPEMAPTHVASWAAAKPGKVHRIITGAAIRAAIGNWRADVSTMRLHQSLLNEIAAFRQRTATLFSQMSPPENDCFGVCFRCHILLVEIRQKSGNPKVAYREMWRADKSRPAVRVSVCLRSGKSHRGGRANLESVKDPAARRRCVDVAPLRWRRPFANRRITSL